MRQLMNAPPPPDRDRSRDRVILRRAASLLSPYRRNVALVIALTAMSSVLGMVNALLVQRLFDDAIGKGNMRLFVIILIAMAAAPTISGFITVWQTWLNATVGQRVMRDLRNELYRHLQRMPMQFFTSTRTGNIQSRLANDVGGIKMCSTRPWSMPFETRLRLSPS